MQPSQNLLNLDQIRISDAPQTGRKAAALGELRAAGFPTPDGVCQTIAAFQKAGERRQISQPFADQLWASGQALLSGSRFLAARSSAAAEDLPGVSFAGQYQSVIGVAGPDALAAAVQSVWDSYNGPGAAAMRSEHGLEGASGGMAVLIQPVIEAEAAGVCFSLDPVAPESGCVVINAVWGLGAGVVDGSLPADTLRLRRDDLVVIEKRIVEKPEQFCLGPRGGIVRAPVPEAQRRAECLPEAWAKRVAQFALAAEQVFGQPQDVEWAIAGGQVWILQSRPIASLPDAAQKAVWFPVTWAASGDARRFWTRTLFERHGKAPLLPLDIDYVRLSESTRVETCLYIGAERNEDFRVINGRVYHTSAALPISPAALRVRRQAYEDLQLRLVREGHTSWDYWGPEIEQANRRLLSVNTAVLDGSGLADFLEAAAATHSRHLMFHPMMWFKPRQVYFEAFAALTGQPEQAIDTPEFQSAAYRCLEGAESPLNRLIDGLYDLAEQARGIPAVAAWIRTVSTTAEDRANVFTDFPVSAPGANGWMAALQAYLAEFGDRNGAGWGSDSLVSTLTWRDRPDQVIRLAARFLDPKVEAPARQRERSRQALEAEVDALCARCPDADVVAAFRGQLETARRGQAVVELHNHHIEQVGLGQLRRAVLAAGGWLQAKGILPDSEDVFWLDFSEIGTAVRSPEWAGGLAEKIAARKADFQDWARLEPPLHLGLPPAALQPRPEFADAVTQPEAQQARRIQGMGASPGRVRGRARVVRDFQPLPDLTAGDILVAENAGPQWMPFFPILGGLVLESGSLGQHAASTAREYGIPAVIGAPLAASRIPDGAWISIDGAAGWVELDALFAE